MGGSQNSLSALIFNTTTRPLYESILTHSYLNRFANGTLDRAHIANIWLVQQGWLSASFPKTFPAILARIPDMPDYADIRQALEKIIKVEAATDTADSHPSQFVKMARFINPALDFNAASMPNPFPETLDFVKKRQSALENRSIFYGLGTLCANEYLNADDATDPVEQRGVMVAYDRGLRRIFPENPDALQYTRTHVAGEEGDAALLYSISQKLGADFKDPACDPKADFDAGIEDYLRSRQVFFDALEHSLG